MKNLEIALIFLPAADIPTFVGQGRVDLGITGRDQVAEYEAAIPSSAEDSSSGVEEVLDLGFGKCRLQVQVPEMSAFQSAEELVGRRIATSFMGLTERFFAELERTGTEEAVGGEGGSEVEVEPGKLRTKIRNLSGSVETACTLGVADGIVDLVGELML